MFHHRSAGEGKQKRNKSKAPGEQRAPIKKVNVGALSKQDRLNTLRQQRQQKREELLERCRLGVGPEDRPPPPKVVMMIPFHTQADALALKRHILALCDPEANSTAVPGPDAAPPHRPAVVQLPNWAQASAGSGRPRLILMDPPRDLMAVLDAAKCADVVLCVMGPQASLQEPAFDPLGYRLLTVLKAQGLPVVVGAVRGSDEAMSASAKRVQEGKKFVARYFASELGAETKLFPAGTDQEVKTLIRTLGSCTPKDISWRSDHGYLLAQEASYSTSDGSLCLRGYVRGPGFRCRHLGHVTGHGDFEIARLAVLPDPCPAAGFGAAARAGGHAAAGDTVMAPGAGCERLVDELRAGEEPDRQRLQPYDPTTAEQTWPTSEEMGEAEASAMPPPPAPGRRRPARSTAVIPAPTAEAGVSAARESGDADMEAASGGEDAACDEEDEDSEGEGTPSIAPSGMAETEDGWDVSSNMTMEVPSAEAVAAERRRREVLLKRSQEDMEFPDEVDTPLEVPARERFQRYRGLKSWRTSPWDPYEDLPVEYSRVWEFEAFASTARAFRQQYLDDCSEIESGGLTSLYCAVYLRGVPPSVMDTQPAGVPFVLSNLFPCEQKVSVMHGTVSRVGESKAVIKSKQEMTLHCGFRRFLAKPTFSEIPRRSSTCKKYKFSRFLQPEVASCASFYAPVVLPPCRLLMFGQGENGQELVGSGSISGADPKQLIIKRAVLTGYPFRTHKAKGVVRFMFFNPTDVRWFKPVELSTKKGLRGHISESLGTHGYMKCRFSGHIKQDDTVCMNLYKRAYPKWYPPAWGGRPEETPEDAA